MSTAAPGRHLAFPFRIGADGRTATPDNEGAHVLGEIVQLLLTSPGERPMLPAFGAGLQRLVFERNDEAGAAVAKALISDSVSRWLGDRVEIKALDVSAGESAPAEGVFTVTLEYEVVATGEVRAVRFEHERT